MSIFIIKNNVFGPLKGTSTQLFLVYIVLMTHMQLIKLSIIIHRERFAVIYFIASIPSIKGDNFYHNPAIIHEDFE